MAPKPKTDPDRADEAQIKPGAAPASVFEGHRLPPERTTDAPAPKVSRVNGARFLGGAWLAADGTPLTAPEAQQAHRAMDRKAADARAAAILGRSTE